MARKRRASPARPTSSASSRPPRRFTSPGSARCSVCARRHCSRSCASPVRPVRCSAPPSPSTPCEATMIPGEMFIQDGEIVLNEGRKTITLTVANTGDRPIQVGSHYHFFETNPALKFDRKKARGMRLDIAPGTAVRFEPGQTREVTLVALGGKRVVYGFRQDVMGKL